MSTALWYYCNLIDDTEASDVVPVVQMHRNAVEMNKKTSRPTASLVLEAIVGDELAVGRSTYVLTASIAATSVEVERTATESIETVNVEAIVPVVSSVDKTMAHPVTVEEKVQESVNEVATVHDAVEDVAVVKEEVVDVVAAEEQKPISIGDMAHESVAVEEMVSEAVGDVPAPALEEKVLEKAEDVMLDVNSAGAVTMSVEADHMDEQIDVISVEKTVEESPMVEVTAAKSATGDESETETQSEISEVPGIETVEAAPAAKVNEAPESEIEETMVIDPDVAAKEAAAIEAQTSSFSFIPEQIRNNSYAVTSVAVAVATAITATLMTRR